MGHARPHGHGGHPANHPSGGQRPNHERPTKSQLPGLWLVLILMLVREGKDGFWKASGFFVGNANGSPVKLLADKCGMLPTGGKPFLTAKSRACSPAFRASLNLSVAAARMRTVTQSATGHLRSAWRRGTAPDKLDTGATGLLDGYKGLAGDGWTALEKYRRRADPMVLQLIHPAQSNLPLTAL